ncbi:MAG: Cof-type HAD-IIB family hydrolase [Candidatus Melainabacteria bacterium]|nr:Cof-type HAD-IIB family hydrolase [Candidatus Melainabacteria bacterium]
MQEADWHQASLAYDKPTMIRLIALDLDGTIVNDALEISARTRRVLSYLIEQTEVRVVVATGRMHLSAYPFAQTLGVREPLISYQGAMIRQIVCSESHQPLPMEQQPVLHHAAIPLPVAERLLPLLEQMQVHLNLYVNDVLYMPETAVDGSIFNWYSQAARVQPTLVPCLQKQLTDAPTKLSVIDDDGSRLPEVMALLQAQCHDLPLTWCQSRHNFCEITHQGVSKWSAIQWLAARYDIAPAEIMAIGDHDNDVSMLTHAGLGVAMGNAPARVQQTADVVTSSIAEDGAAEAIERYVIEAERFCSRV